MEACVLRVTETIRGASLLLLQPEVATGFSCWLLCERRYLVYLLLIILPYFCSSAAVLTVSGSIRVKTVPLIYYNTSLPDRDFSAIKKEMFFSVLVKLCPQLIYHKYNFTE